jgi:hypothetical protein
MSIGTRCVRLVRRSVLVPVVFLTAAAWNSQVNAQDNNNVDNSVNINIVGGVSIDANGMLTNTERDANGNLPQLRRDALEPIPDGMNRTAGLRKISLRRLEAEIKKCVEAGKPLPEAMSLLAGLQQIRYVFVYPEEQDIVLAGPAEAWALDPRGYFVGVHSGRPVMFLDDLLVAWRAAASSPSVLSCSINPTPEGIRRVESLVRQMKGGVDPRAAGTAVEEQLGPQRITVSGVPDTSHFARVLVAADYRMKRISMGLEPAPVRGLPSYTEMVKAGGPGMSNMLPRWWLEPDYQPLLRDDGGLAWELRGAAVRCMTENDYLDANRVARPSGRSDPVTQRWADLMTGRYQDLAQADPVFAQLQNCMDLAVVSALIVKERLPGKAGQQFPILTGAAEGLPTIKLDAPKQVATSASLARKGKKTMVAAGGVQINPWTLADKAEKNADLPQVRGKQSGKRHTNWWWD